jgi:hypothetical protein
MTPVKKPVFSGSDAWLLLSIAVGEGRDGATLRDIISVGDYINHSIFTGAEIRRGIAKLSSCGYIRERNGGFRISGKAKSFWKTIWKPGRPLLQLWDEWEKFLEVPSLPAPDDEDPEWPYPAVTDERIKQAYAEYTAGFSSRRRKAVPKK